MRDANTTTPMDLFIQLSALVTGFSATKLAPGLDPVNLKKALFDFAQSRTGAVFDALLVAFQQSAEAEAGTIDVSSMSAEQRQAIGNRVLGLDGASQDAQVAATAQSVNKAWYLGSWYQPFDYTDGAGTTYEAGSQVVISSQAYIGGLAWKAMQSHAMGNSTFTFGYWASEPPSLEAFTGNPQPTATTQGSTTQGSTTQNQGSAS